MPNKLLIAKLLLTILFDGIWLQFLPPGISSSNVIMLHRLKLNDEKYEVHYYLLALSFLSLAFFCFSNCSLKYFVSQTSSLVKLGLRGYLAAYFLLFIKSYFNFLIV